MKQFTIVELTKLTELPTKQLIDYYEDLNGFCDLLYNRIYCGSANPITMETYMAFNMCCIMIDRINDVLYADSVPFVSYNEDDIDEEDLPF